MGTFCKFCVVRSAVMTTSASSSDGAAAVTDVSAFAMGMRPTTMSAPSAMLLRDQWQGLRLLIECKSPDCFLSCAAAAAPSKGDGTTFPIHNPFPGEAPANYFQLRA